jgi:hypothetical protein
MQNPVFTSNDLFNQDKLLAFIENIVRNLRANETLLQRLKTKYQQQQEKNDFQQGTRETILKICSSEFIWQFPENIREHVIPQCVRHIDLAETSAWLQLYNELCKLLEVHVVIGIPFISKDVDNANHIVEINGVKFVGQNVNKGLEEDKELFSKFIKEKHRGFVVELLNNLGKDLKTEKNVEVLMKAANLVRVPPNTEVVIYFAGHGSEGGDWCVYDTKNKSVVISFKAILDWWISQKQAKDNHLTIISDCCFSGAAAQFLKNNENYHEFPICIQASCAPNENAYATQLLTAMINNTSIEFQQPCFYRTPAHCSRIQNVFVSTTGCNVTDLPPRRNLEQVANKKIREACKFLISKWKHNSLDVSQQAHSEFIKLTRNEEKEYDVDKFGLRIDIQARVHKVIDNTNRVVLNIQVQVGNKSYAQIMLQAGFNAGFNNIQAALLFSLDQTIRASVYSTNHPFIEQTDENKIHKP